MKHFFSIILIAVAMIYSPKSHAQEVNKTQWSLMTERTADWCSNCGSWGWNLKTKSIEGLKNEPFIFVAMHTSGGLANAASQKFASIFPGSGQPIFYLDKDNINANSSNVNSVFEDVKATVEFNKSAGAFAGIGIDATYDNVNKSIKIDAKVEALQKIAASDMSLALYVLEDKIAYQQNQGNNADHKNLVLAAAYDKAEGESIFSGTIEEGATFTKNVTINQITADYTKLSVIGILWNKNVNGTLFFNAYEVPVKLQSNVSDAKLAESFKVYVNEANDIVVDINSDVNIDDVKLTLTDGNGRIINTINKDIIPNGKSVLTINNPGSAGTYFVTMNTSSSRTTKQVIVF